LNPVVKRTAPECVRHSTLCTKSAEEPFGAESAITNSGIRSDYKMKPGGCGEVLTYEAVRSRFAITVTVSFAVVDEEIDDAVGTCLSVSEAVLPVEACSSGRTAFRPMRARWLF